MFKTLSIQRKLQAVMMLTTAISLALAGVAFTAYEFRNTRSSEEQTLKTLGEIVSQSSTPYLAFPDSNDAARALSALVTKSHVRDAALYDAHGKVFASYRSHTVGAEFPEHPLEDGLYEESGSLVWFQPVREGSVRYGTLFIRWDLSHMYASLRFYVAIALAVFVGALLAAYVISRALRKSISQPILSLAQTAEAVAKNDDYSVRAQKFSDDELGALTTTFNQMLGTIQEHQSRLSQELLQRRQAEAAVRESEERYRATFHNAAIGIAHVALDGTILQTNDAFCRIAGYSAADLVSKKFEDITHPDDIRPDWQLANRAIDGEISTFSMEKRYIRKDGSVVWANLTASMLRNEDGSPRYFISVVEDIDARKRAERAVRESEERFRTLGDNIAQLAWMANRDGSIFWYNKRWFDYTGTTLDQMVSSGRQIVHHPDHVSRVVAKWCAHLEKGVQWEDTFPIRGANGGYRWFLSRAYPIRDADGQIVRWFGTNTDVSELRETQEALQRAQTELRQHADTLELTVATRTAELKESNEQLEALVYTIAHDLRGPLRSMQGFSELLLEDEPTLPHEQRDYLRRIRASAEYMDKMILDLLAFGRASRAQMDLVPVDLQSIWKSAVYQCNSQIEQTKAIVELSSPLPIVLANEPTLTQILANLLNNALKFTRPGTTPHIRCWCEQRDHSVRLWIEDNGIGIESIYHERIFRVFERLDGKRYSGTGVGLAIVRKGIERMNGRVGLESEIGRGTRFWIELSKP